MAFSFPLTSPLFEPFTPATPPPLASLNSDKTLTSSFPRPPSTDMLRPNIFPLRALQLSCSGGGEQKVDLITHLALGTLALLLLVAAQLTLVAALLVVVALLLTSAAALVDSFLHLRFGSHSPSASLL